MANNSKEEVNIVFVGNVKREKHLSPDLYQDRAAKFQRDFDVRKTSHKLTCGTLEHFKALKCRRAGLTWSHQVHGEVVDQRAWRVCRRTENKAGHFEQDKGKCFTKLGKIWDVDKCS